MIINYEEQHLDLEEEGHCNLVLIGARYTGGKSSVTVNKYRTQAAWPGNSPFQGGPLTDDGGREPGSAQGALLPDWTDEDTENRTVEALESDPDIEVLYDPSDIAEEMLRANYLDPNVFGRGFNAEVRDRVFDALGLEDVGARNEAEYRKQLREIAGVEAEPDARQVRDDQRVVDYRRENTRRELIAAARILGKESPDECGKIELATWLADRDPEAVRFAFEDNVDAARNVLAGDDTTPTEELTVDAAVDGYSRDELKTVVKKARTGTGEITLRGKDKTDLATFLVDSKGLSEAEIDAHLMD
jgi:hypothetical protein